MNEFKLGDSVVIRGPLGHKSGVVAYIGKIKYKLGEWYGIELSNPDGKNDGSVEGTRYFQCKPNHGLFVRKSQICKQTDDIVQEKNTEQLENRKVSRTSKLSPNTVKNKLETPTLKVGERIILKDGRTGILSYIGKTDFKLGIWAGIELDDKVGKHDGCVKGKRYFQCKPQHGLFVKTTAVGLASNMRSEASNSTIVSENTSTFLKDQAKKLQSRCPADPAWQFKSNRPNTMDSPQQYPSTDTESLTLSSGVSTPKDLDGILQSSENTGNSRLKMYYDRIVQGTELDKGVMDYLISLCVMSTEDREEVKREPTTSGRNRIILDILIDRPYETCRDLKEALQIDPNYSELVNDMDFATEKTDVCDRFSQFFETIDIKDFTVKLYKNYKRIADQIADIEHICDSLVSAEVISVDERQEITKHKIIPDCNRCLLSKLIRKPLSAYTSFVKILNEDDINKDLADGIEQTPVEEHDIQRLKIGLIKCKERQECRQTNKDKALEARTKNMEIQMADNIPQHRREQIGIILRSWWKDKTFVATHAAEIVCKFIRENNCVTVTGNSGVGKTTAVRHAARVLLLEGYEVVPDSTPEDILNFYNPKRKTLFVIDDLCGKYTLNQQYLNEWKRRLDTIKALLENSPCKIMATCRLQVFKDERFKDLSIFSSCECNLSSKELSLSSKEKSGLINAYCGEHASDVSDQINSDFFPLVCILFKATNSTGIIQFFNNPFQFYDEEIGQLLKEDDTGKYKYCCLVLVVIFNNRLKEEFLSGKISSKVQKILKAVLSECELNKGTSPKCLLRSLKTLEGTFLVHEEGCCRTIHDKLFDYLSHYFGNKMIHILIDHADSQFICERFIWKTTDTDLTSGQTTDTDFTINLPDKYLDVYIDRMIKDWSDDKVLGVFTNRNMKSKNFTAKLLDHMNQLDKSKQSELANMKLDNRFDDTTLMASCFMDDVNFTRWIINHGVSVNHCRYNGASPLHIACENGHIDTVRERIKSGSDLQECNNNGTSPLYIACQNGHTDTVSELIKSGSDLQKCNNNGASPLCIACYNGHTDTVRELIKSGSDLQKCTYDGTSPLYIACQNGHIDTLRELIKWTVDINTCIHVGVSPLFIAVVINNKEIVEVLLDNDSDVNKCVENKEKCCEAIVKYHRKTADSYMDWFRDDFIFKYALPMVKHYIQESLGNNVMDLVVGSSPLHMACFMGHVDIVKLILDKNPNINITKEDGTTPLFLACQFGHTDIVKLMIEKGADNKVSRNYGKSPFDIALDNGHSDVISLLTGQEKESV